jgi:hypothetical protein
MMTQEEKDALPFTFEYIKLNSTMLTIHLTFDTQVADSETKPDLLFIRLKSIFLFVSEKWRMPLNENDLIINATVPLQILKPEYKGDVKTWTVVTQVLKTMIEFLAGYGLLFNLIFGYSMNKLWSMINGIQIINHYPLFYLVAPNNLGVV